MSETAKNAEPKPSLAQVATSSVKVKKAVKQYLGKKAHKRAASSVHHSNKSLAELPNVVDTNKLFPVALAWKERKFSGVIPASRSSHTMTTTNLGQSMVIFGGYGNDLLGDVIVVDGSTFNCVSLAALDQPELRVGHTCIELFNSLYIFGGWNGREYLDYGCLLSLETRHMLYEDSKSRVIPAQRRDHTLSRIGRQMYLFGGWDTLTQYNDLWVLDRQKSWTWRNVPTLGQAPIPRRGHTAVVHGNQIWVFGGVFGYSKYLNDVCVLDTNTLEWTTPVLRGEGPSPRAWHSATMIGETGMMLVFGGTAGRHHFYNDLYVLHLSNQSWHKITLPADASPSPRCSHSACMLGGQLVIFGGLGLNDINNVEPLGDCFVLDTGVSVAWNEQKEEEMQEDSTDDDEYGVGDDDEDDEPPPVEGWLACQHDDEEKWGRGYFRLVGNELRGYDYKLKGCVSLAGGLCKQWTNKRAESGMEIPEVTDIEGLSTMLTSLLAGTGSVKQKEFIGFCKSIYAYENVEFYLAADEYRKQQLTGNALTEQAQYLYHRYIKFGAEYEVHASAKIKQRIKKAIKSKTFDNTLFDKALRAVYIILRSDTLPKYVENLKQKASIAEGAEQLKLKSALNDEDMRVEACENCMVKFSFARRRNFCRFCGNIYCAACANQQVTLPPQYGVHTRVRVCDMCSGVLSNREGHHAFSFHSHKRNRPLNLAVESEREMLDWMNKFAIAADTTKNVLTRKQGWMMKEDPTTKIFRRRYFILTGRKLYYFELTVTRTMDLEDQGMIGQISMGSTVPISTKEVDGFLAGEDHKYRFTVMNSTRAFRLAAATAETRDYWVALFKRAIVGQLTPDAMNDASATLFDQTKASAEASSKPAEKKSRKSLKRGSVIPMASALIAAQGGQKTLLDPDLVLDERDEDVDREYTRIYLVCIGHASEEQAQALLDDDHLATLLNLHHGVMLETEKQSTLDSLYYFFHVADALRFSADYMDRSKQLSTVGKGKDSFVAESLGYVETEYVNIAVHCQFVLGVERVMFTSERRQTIKQDNLGPLPKARKTVTAHSMSDMSMMTFSEDGKLGEALDDDLFEATLEAEEFDGAEDDASSDSEDGAGVMSVLGMSRMAGRNSDDDEDDEADDTKSFEALESTATDLPVGRPQSMGYLLEFCRQMQSSLKEQQAENDIVITTEVVRRFKTKTKKAKRHSIHSDDKRSVLKLQSEPWTAITELNVDVEEFTDIDDQTSPVRVLLHSLHMK